LGLLGVVHLSYGKALQSTLREGAERGNALSINKERVERKRSALGIDHRTLLWQDGSVTLHAKTNCSNIRAGPMTATQVVDILWEANPENIQWCHNCAVQSRRSKQ
jgi:hypothetical protein